VIRIELTDQERAELQQALWAASCMWGQYTRAYELFCLKVMQQEGIEQLRDPKPEPKPEPRLEL
jgi:hypothetical protein